MLSHEPIECLGDLERVQIFALHVLDERELERLLGGDILHHHQELVKPGSLRRAPAAFAGDDLVAVA